VTVPSTLLREYDARRDAAALRACFVELQDYERSVGRDAPPGDAVADAYLAHMLDCCRRFDGTVFVAEIDGAVVGFVCVWAKVPPEEPDEAPVLYGFVSDLVVLARCRGRGIGRALLRRAEGYARDHGAVTLRIGVVAQNRNARRLYEQEGFSDRYVFLVKPLGRVQA
jgi:GNAT superfamily N-acetyltransferase